MSGHPHPTAPVAIVGAGPVGLALALGLARQAVSSVVLEKSDSTSEFSKAPGIHVRTREVFRLWGIEQRFLEAGTLVRELAMHSATTGQPPFVRFDFGELEAEADEPGLLILEQGRTEKLLLDAVQETGRCDVRFGAEATDLAQDGDGVTVSYVEDGEERSMRAAFVVGCDGADSFVRKTLGLPFEGGTYELRPVLADVRIDDERDELPWPRACNAGHSYSFAIRLEAGLWRVINLDRDTGMRSDDVPDDEAREIASTLLGPGPMEVVWKSRFQIHIRSSPRFRVRRILLAGDAAHVHSPAGGFGMNGGIHDAHNLSWKLAAVLAGGDIERLLDSYEVERREVIAESVSPFTDVVTRVFVSTPASIRQAAFALVRTAMRIGRVRRRLLRRTAMIDLDYPTSPLLKSEWPSAGVRLPNPLLRAPDGSESRLYDLLSEGPTLIDMSRDPLGAAAPVENVVRIGPDGYRDPSGLLERLLEGDEGWILVRPDAHVAWALDSRSALEEAASSALGAGSGA